MPASYRRRFLENPFAVGAVVTCLLVATLFGGSASAQVNHIANPSFDDDLSGWTIDEEVASWSTVDANDDPSSGSAMLISNGGDPADESYLAGMKQCLHLTPGTTYTVGSKIRIPPGEPGTAEGFVFLFYYATSDCTGLELGADLTDPVFQGTWKYVSTTFVPPSGTGSVSVLLMTRYLPDLKCQYDDVFVKEGIIPPPPHVSFSASPSSIFEGESSTLTWTTKDADSVSITPGLGTQPVNGSVSVSPTTSTTYFLSATGPGGITTAKATVNVGPPPPPEIDFVASPSTIMIGQSSTLSWNVANATSVSIDNGLGLQQTDGSVSVTPLATTTYTLTATGPGGTRTAQAKVTVLIPSPSVTFSASPLVIAPGGSSTLTWTTQHASSVSIDNGIGTQPLSGSIAVSPASTTLYTLTATGPGGTATAQITVTVAFPLPVVAFSADPLLIDPGQSSTLTWTTSNATSVSIDNGVGAQPLSGTIAVSPAATTTYRLTATGAGGTTVSQVTVSVGTPAPTIAFSANPPAIIAGEMSTLQWTTGGATSVSIDNGVGPQSLSGSTQVSPDATTVYTLTATGAGGTVSATATVSVTTPSPTIEFLANPPLIVAGKSSTLTWTVTHATTVSIDNGLGQRPVNGSVPVTPETTTTYTLTATGPGGTATSQVTVFVGTPAPTVNFTANPVSIPPGGSSTLSWTTANATAVSIDNGLGAQPATGTATVSPQTDTTWTLTATGEGGTTTKQATVRITYPLPAIVFTASPDVIAAGASSTLSWTTQNATTVSIDQSIGSQPVNGSISVSPAATTTYTLTASGPGGSVSATVTVTIASAACTAAPSGLSISWLGESSGCTPAGGACRPGETIAFSANASGYAFQTCDAFLWGFGDGTESTSTSPHKTYAARGGFDVTLTVTNPQGTAAATAHVDVGTARKRAVKR